ncbi:MAG: holo-ACP synthase [Candidatus Acetothermia bacterium]|nr:holo-ACP synthase [Candidatus Acetothermia bacterium]MDH7505031.1 holo-ACP synthase [Candidatus Acetothermia bacterium]
MEIGRIERLVDRWGERFLKRVFTEEELRSSLGRRRSAEHLAARFAAKEALIKAAGLPSGWRRIEISNRRSGEPYFSQLPEGLAPERVRLSLSHAAGVAMAIVLIEASLPRRPVAPPRAGAGRCSSDGGRGRAG